VNRNRNHREGAERAKEGIFFLGRTEPINKTQRRRKGEGERSTEIRGGNRRKNLPVIQRSIKEDLLGGGGDRGAL